MIAAPFDVSTDPVVVPAHASTRFAVLFTPEMEATAAGTLFLETNDPDDPLVLVMLRGSGLPPMATDAGVGDAGVVRPGPVADGGCGCRVASAQERSGDRAALALLATAALVVVRRRRKR